MANTDKKAVAIIDTGCANLNSVRFALLRLGITPLITDKADEILKADRVILPGVGSAKAAMAAIYAKRLDKVIPRLTQPVLGICLGMQLLCKQSSENQHQTPCLNLIDIEINQLNSHNLPLPHMGWNRLKPSVHPLFFRITGKDYFYFVHSFCAPNETYMLASCEYGQDFSAAIGKDNFLGVQFHPEKSADAGQQILKNFLELCG